MARLRMQLIGQCLLAACLAAGPAATTQAQQRSLTLASTTSTEQSGLFGHLLAIFRAATGIEVRVVAVGTGQALLLAVRGDCDAVLVHDRAGEEDLVAKGHGIDRRDVMYNDFVLIGPAKDPAGLRGAGGVTPALKGIARVQAAFVSRGDDSGTHRLERRLWRAAGLTPDGKASPWYREVGTGMGPALNTAAGLDAYILADRATWASFKNRGTLAILLEGDPTLFNPYSSILVNPAKGGHIRAEEARIWHDWLTSVPGRAAIRSFQLEGTQMFFLPDPSPRG
jgi:tungstate transport system substrate-binding protein